MNIEREQLKKSISRRIQWRQHIVHPKRYPNSSPLLPILRQWQTQRLRNSFKDVLAQPSMTKAGEFFLTDLYSDQDFSGRDRDIDRLMPIMVHILPHSMLSAARDAIELHALSHALDLKMVLAMENLGYQQLDIKKYQDIYRLVGHPRLRQRQIDLVVEVGESLDHAVHTHGVHRLLKMSRLPAMAAGLSQIQQFLERGFNAFAQLNGATLFLDRVSKGETQISQQLFANQTHPFSIDCELSGP